MTGAVARAQPAQLLTQRACAPAACQRGPRHAAHAHCAAGPAPPLLHRALAGKVGVPLLVADAYSLRLDEEDLKDDSGPPGLVVRCV